MRNKVKSIVKKVPKETTLPDGLYNGTWGGYVIELTYDKEIYELATENGVRGINIPVVVEVKDGVITFDTVRT
jgi:hypothetical protein